jgi:hypothetical protein
LTAADAGAASNPARIATAKTLTMIRFMRNPPNVDDPASVTRRRRAVDAM